jgi:hypothetical protein
MGKLVLLASPPKLHQSICYKPHSSIYPTNTSVHTPLISKPLTSTLIFRPVMHPHGIGPTKTVIRVPGQAAMDAPANLMLHISHAVVKSSPALHSTVQCQCRQLVCVSNGQTCNMPLYHTLCTFISHFISQSFLFPPQIFSHFAFS